MLIRLFGRKSAHPSTRPLVLSVVEGAGRTDLLLPVNSGLTEYWFFPMVL
jgi:hypothetical protein